MLAPAEPTQSRFYIQDKLEFKDVVVQLGLSFETIDTGAMAPDSDNDGYWNVDEDVAGTNKNSSSSFPQNDQDQDYFSDEFETLLGTNVEEPYGYEDWSKFEDYVDATIDFGKSGIQITEAVSKINPSLISSIISDISLPGIAAGLSLIQDELTWFKLQDTSASIAALEKKINL